MTRVCVVGGGGQLAEGISAWLVSRRHQVVHYRPNYVHIPGVPIRPPRPRGRLERFAVSVEENAQIEACTSRYKWADRWEVSAADVFVFCLPSFLAEFVGAHLASAMNGKFIVNLSDRFMGTVALCRAATTVIPRWKAGGAVSFNSPPALSYQRERNRATSVLFTKPFVLAAPTVGSNLRSAEAVVSDLFGIDQIRWLPSSLELAFENINSIVHAVQDLHCLRNNLLGRPGSLYDTNTYTQATVDRIDAVTDDRDAIAKHLTSLKYRNLREFDGSTFAASLDFRPGTPSYRHYHPILSGVPRPSGFSAHGYEDVGWSLVPLESVGNLLEVPTPALSALIDDWNSLMRVEYRSVGRTAASLGITKFSLHKILTQSR